MGLLGPASLVAILFLLVQPAAGLASAQSPEQVTEDGSAEAIAQSVLAIDVSGNRRVSADQIRAAFAQKVGDLYDETLIARGIELLWRTFGVRAEVRRLDLVNGVRLQIDVVEVPFDFSPRFEGNERVETRELLE